MQPSSPTDGRYGENPNRLYTTISSVVIKTLPGRTSGSCTSARWKELGMDPTIHDIRFVRRQLGKHRRWAARGLGWEVWLNGMEVHAVHLLPAGGRLWSVNR